MSYTDDIDWITQDINWIWDNYEEFKKTYPNQFIAVRDLEIITAGSSQATVIKIARYQLGHSEFVVEFIDSGEAIGLYFSNSIKAD
ncbi:MAG: hypothetical protein ACFFCQ_10720 [Promethearchaeota archaeon]